MATGSLGADRTNFSDAAASFRRFFVELKAAFFEREALFEQLELALLCREHLLIIGPPGTAKSAIASSTLSRIIDEKSGLSSVFAKQLAENTVQADLIGPVDFKALTETGRTEHLTDEGMLGSVYSLLDEVFDGRDMLLRSILNVLQERELKHGRKTTSGRCECAVMTSNRYLSEVVLRSPEMLQAFADRVSFIGFTPKSFARSASRAQMLWRATSGQRPVLRERLTLQSVQILQAAVDAVVVPALVTEGLEVLADALERSLLAQVAKLPDYVPTKYFSQRSMVKALWALKAAVVHERIYRRPDRPLEATLADLSALRAFFLLGGPSGDEIELLLKNAADPRERAQLEIIRVEQRAFEEALTKVAPALASSLEREAAELAANKELAAAEAVLRVWSSPTALTLARALRSKLVPGPRHPENRAALSRAAAALLNAAEAQATRALSTTGEDRLATLAALREVLQLASAVPELALRAPSLAATVSQLAQQAAQLSALQAEALELDDGVRLEELVSQAAELKGELASLAESFK